MDITIKTGIETYRIRDEKKNVIAEFQFNPGDISAVRRMQDVDAQLKNYKMPDTSNSGNDIAEVEQMLEDKFNYMLGYDASKGLFGRYSPLTALEHQFFFQAILTVIKEQIQTGVEKRAKEIAEQTDKVLNEIEE